MQPHLHAASAFSQRCCMTCSTQPFRLNQSNEFQWSSLSLLHWLAYYILVNFLTYFFLASECLHDVCQSVKTECSKFSKKPKRKNLVKLHPLTNINWWPQPHTPSGCDQGPGRPQTSHQISYLRLFPQRNPRQNKTMQYHSFTFEFDYSASKLYYCLFTPLETHIYDLAS